MNARRERSAKFKLILGFLLVIGLYVTFGFISYYEVQTVGRLTKMIYNHPLVVSNASLMAGLNMTKMHRNMKDVVLSGSPDELGKAADEVRRYEQLVYQHMDVIREMIIGDEGRDIEKRTRQLFSDWKPIREEVLTLYHTDRKDIAASITKGKGAGHVAKLEDKMLELTSYARKKADSFMRLSEQKHAEAERISILLVLAGVFLSVFIAYFTVRHTLKVEKALLEERNELQKAVSEIKTLSGLLPICASCKKIRDDKGYWNQIEAYIREHSQAEFSHGICPACAEKLYGSIVHKGE